MNEIIKSQEQIIIEHIEVGTYFNAAIAYITSLDSEGSKRVQGDALDAIANILGHESYMTCPWHKLSPAHVNIIRATIAHTYSPSTTNRFMTALRGVFKNAWRLEQITAEQRERLSDIRRYTGETADAAAGRALSADELGKLFTVCRSDQRPIGIRDTALLAVLRGAGLRRAEAAGLLIANYNPRKGQIKLIGKRNKERVNPLHSLLCQDIDEWLKVRKIHAGRFVFCQVLKNETLAGDGLSEQAVYAIVKKRALDAAIETFTPHDMRRTFAGDLLDKGKDIATVKKLMGHSNINTTAGYDRRDEKAMRDAVDDLDMY